MDVCSANWKTFGRKAVFYDELRCEWDMYSADDLIMWLGDFNRHIGRHFDGGCGVGQVF